MRKHRQRVEREIALLKEPGTIDAVCNAVANKQSLSAWCAEKDVRFSHVWGWIMADRDRTKRYASAVESRTARLTDKVITRMEALLDADPRKAAGRGGKMLPLHKLPDSVAAAVSEFSDSPRGGTKLKLVTPDRAVELAGRHLGMFRDKLEVSGEVGVASRLAAARQRAGRK